MAGSVLVRNRLFIISCVIFAVVILLVAAVSSAVEQRLEAYVTDQVETVTRETGVRLSYEQLHIRLFSAIELTDVSIGFTSGNLITAERISLSYQLYNYLFSSGRKDINFNFSGLQATFDQKKLQESVDFVEYILSIMPPIENIFVRFNFDESHISYDQEKEFRIEAILPELSVLFVNQQLSFALLDPIRATYRSSQTDSPISHIQADVTPDFRLLGQGRMALDLPDTRVFVNEQEIRPFDVHLSRSSADAPWRVSAGGDELSVDVRYDGQAEFIGGHFFADRLEIKDYLDLAISAGVLEPDRSEMIQAGTVSLTGSADYDLATEYLIYDADVEIGDLKLDMLESVVSASASVRGDQYHITAERLIGGFEQFRISGNISTDFDNLFNAAGSLKLENTVEERVLADIRFRKAEQQLYTMISTPLLEGFLAEGLSSITSDDVRLQGVLSFDGYALASTIEVLFEDRSFSLTGSEERLRVYGNQTDDGFVIMGALHQFMLPLSKITDGRIGDLPADMKVSAFFENPSNWNARIEQARVDDISFADRTFSTQFSASVTPEYTRFNSLIIDDGFSPLSGSGLIQYGDAAFLFSAGLSDDRELYEIEGKLVEDQIFLDLETRNARVERFIADQAFGEISGALQFSSSGDSYELEADIGTSDELSVNDQTISGDFTISADERSARVQSERITISNQDIADVRIDYRASEGRLSVSGSTDFELDQRQISTDVVLDAQGHAFTYLHEFSLEQASSHEIAYEVHTENLSVNGETTADWSGSGTYQNKFITLLTGMQQEISLSARTDTGEFSLDLKKSDLPISMQLRGEFSEGRIYAESDNVRFDADMFNALNIGFLEFTEGSLSGNLIVTGVLDDLEYYGEMLSDSISFTTDMTTGIHSVSNLYISLAGKEILFTPFTVETGNSLARARLSLYIDDIIPRSIDLQLEVPRTDLISVRQEFPGMRISYDGGLSGTVHVFGFFNDLSIGGDLFLDRGTVSMIPPSKIKPETPSAITSVDIRLTSGRNLTGIFPNIDLPIIVARFADGQRIRVDADIARGEFDVVGALNLRGGEIVYFQRNFFIQGGELNLNIDENNFEPRISLSARLKDFDREGNKVDIYLGLDNDPVSQLNPSFTSRPEMTLAEISQILGRNIIPENILGTTDLTAALAFATLATDVIQQVGLIELDPIQELEVSIRNTLNLDLFSIRTMVFQNILLDTIPGEYANSFTRNPIARYLDNTTLLMGKYIRDDMFIQAIIQLSIREETGIGFFFTNDLGLDIELSYEWDTPLYNLSLALQPESFSVNQLLNSLSLGVSWSFSL
jgi:hypothetical protein